MKIRRVLVSSLCAVSLVSLSACVTDPNTGEKKVRAPPSAASAARWAACCWAA
jgi:hypothetical protein